MNKTSEHYQRVLELLNMVNRDILDLRDASLAKEIEEDIEKNKQEEKKGPIQVKLAATDQSSHPFRVLTNLGSGVFRVYVCAESPSHDAVAVKEGMIREEAEYLCKLLNKIVTD